MPYSTGYFKEEIKNYILNSYEKNIKILDVGAGCGTYSDLLKPLGYNNIDCVEIFEEYIQRFKLNEKYNKVYLGDVTNLDIDFKNYDLIILGDVLEHINLDDAKKLLNKIENINTIIGVPFNSPQGEHFGNVNEIHQQEDLTFINFFERYGGQKPLCLRFDYGIFVKKESSEIFIEVGEKPLPKEYEEYLKNNFSNYKVFKLNESEEVADTKNTNNKVTIVTGIWDLGRGNISDSFKRSYNDYLEKLRLLLDTDVNMYIFIDKSDEEFIWKYRKKENTVVNIMSLDELKTWFNFTNKVNEIRNDPEWLNLAGWLSESPQASLEGYNPVVMSKMFMLNNVTIWNPFNSEYFFWIDGGITNTVHYGYFTHNKVFNNLPEFIDNNNEFVFLTYPYEGGNEIHGFKREDIHRYSDIDYVRFVCRGGFFGGTKNRINYINGIYYGYLNNSLNEGLMGTEESIFTIILHRHPELITQYNIKSDGLIWPFFEDLKNKEYKKNILSTIPLKNKLIQDKGVALYVITFNSPSQFETLIESMIRYDHTFIDGPKKYLLDNSTDLSTTPKYIELCQQYGFEHIKKNNLGICGGRQFIAEHFESTGLDYYFFFEDDMFFYPKEGSVCRNGFNRYFDEFYKKTLEIIQKEDFDFLKLNYSEFYGDNGTQWAWYNVPQHIREEYWPNNKKLPQIGLDPNAPKTLFEKVLSHSGVPYTSGEIYYCNWPQIVSKNGNKKMFLDTKWTYPYEQTWMSHIYQETKKGNIKPGLILGTPTEHNRFDFYPKEERREN